MTTIDGKALPQTIKAETKEEVWAMLQNAKLLKHRILIGLLYGCGLRCMEARSVRIQDMDLASVRDTLGHIQWYTQPLAVILSAVISDIVSPSVVNVATFSDSDIHLAAPATPTNQHVARWLRSRWRSR